MQEFEWLNLTLAQETELPSTGGSAPTTGMTGAESAPLSPGGSGGGGGGSTPPSPLGGSFMIIIILMIFVMLIVSMMSQRREKKRREAMVNAIKKHDRVQTIGGVIGSVVEVKPDYIILKVDESSNTRITFARSAIQQVLNVSVDASTTAKAEPGK